MPAWGAADLIEAPRFTWRYWFGFLGPGLLMGGSAIGGGEWLTGPAVTARYGGAVMWLATLSIVGQVIYNIEISRYTLYTGEPIFTGKFRTPPGPRFWLWVYLLLDFGAVFPYLAANAATPLAAVILGGVLPDPENNDGHWWLMRILGYVIFLFSLGALLVGGKIYNSLKAVISFKIVTVLGFLLVLGLFHSSPSTWFEIFSGFFKFGEVPTAGNETVNIFGSIFKGEGLPLIDFSTIALLAAFAAMAGNGGLSNTPISNYTRDQGWGMGHHVGAIPSIIGGRHISLSHVGKVFAVNRDSLVRWRRWYRHVARDQLALWAPACLFGVALPAMLSVEFLPRGVEASSWVAAGMTADGIDQAVARNWTPGLGRIFWYLTMFCGFLVLAPSMAASADGIIRRWVDVFWTSSPRLRQMDPKKIGVVYFKVLSGYALFGLIMLSVAPPLTLLTIAANLFNYALGFSCFHTLAINLTLLPPELRPGWWPRIGLVCTGCFFLLLAIVTTMNFLGWMD